MYNCVDLVANVFGENTETSFFEGREDYVSQLVQRSGKHCSVIEWVRVYEFSSGINK